MMDDDTILTIYDYLDGRLDTAGRVAFEARLAAEPAVRAELDAALRLRAETDALPRRLEPDRDLWSEIASRLEASGPAKVDLFGFRTRGRMPIGRYLLAAAAVALFAVSLPIFYVRAPEEAPSDVATTPNALTSDPEFQRVTLQYLAARDELLALLEQRKDDIPAETYSVVTENLDVIASAVTEIEMALAEQPESAKLERMLYAAYQSEVNLLRQAVQLSGAPAASNEANEADAPLSGADEGDSDAV